MGSSDTLYGRAAFRDSSNRPQAGLVDGDGHVQVDIMSGGGLAGQTFDDGDTIDTDSQGTLFVYTTAIPGTAVAARGDATNGLDVDVTRSALPTGAATQVTLASLAAEDFATQATLAAVLAELEQKTQPADQQHAIVDASALPTGAATLAEQQTQSASLSVLDDWDESDRAKVNPIVGQAGVQGGSGVVTPLTQRVVLATDGALPAGTNEVGTVRTRSEDTAYLHHNAGGVTSVAADTWVTLATLTVADGVKLRLLMAEGDFTNLSSLDVARAIRIAKAGTVISMVISAASAPNPQIEGLTLENTSGADETWTLQGRHGGSITARDMTGWFTWVRVSDS